MVIGRGMSANARKKTSLTCTLIYIPDIVLGRRTPLQWKGININIHSPSSNTDNKILQVILLHYNDIGMTSYCKKPFLETYGNFSVYWSFLQLDLKSHKKEKIVLNFLFQ